MKKRANRPASAPAVGASSLLVVFAVLILLVFALLTLATVQADSRLSANSCQAVQNYYAADYRANEILAALRAGEEIATVTREGNICSYQCEIDADQSLAVRAELGEDGAYSVTAWQVIYHGDWQADDSLNVWDGQLPEEE